MNEVAAVDETAEILQLDVHHVTDNKHSRTKGLRAS